MGLRHKPILVVFSGVFVHICEIHGALRAPLSTGSRLIFLAWIGNALIFV